jgi:hypothetical protein
MLRACHERVQRSLDLLRRLIEYLDTRGHDRSTRSAAADVLRYFDIAAPLHHEDEELHVFPALADSADAALREAIAVLRDDHVRMAERWARARGVLLGWRDDPAPTPLDEPSRALLKAQQPHRVFQPLERQRVHALAHQLLDDGCSGGTARRPAARG